MNKDNNLKFNNLKELDKYIITFTSAHKSKIFELLNSKSLVQCLIEVASISSRIKDFNDTKLLSILLSNMIKVCFHIRELFSVELVQKIENEKNSIDDLINYENNYISIPNILNFVGLNSLKMVFVFWNTNNSPNIPVEIYRENFLANISPKLIDLSQKIIDLYILYVSFIYVCSDYVNIEDVIKYVILKNKKKEDITLTHLNSIVEEDLIKKANSVIERVAEIAKEEQPLKKLSYSTDKDNNSNEEIITTKILDDDNKEDSSYETRMVE